MRRRHHLHQSQTENPFINACQRMHAMAVSCRNWQNTVNIQATQLMTAESGYMRSIRLGVLHPVTHEVTAQSTLQLVVIPGCFDGLQHEGYDRKRWQLLIYSWLGRTVTQQLRDYLESKESLTDCTFLLVHPDKCEKL